MVTDWTLMKMIDEFLNETGKRKMLARDISQWIKAKYGIDVSSIRIACLLRRMGFKKEWGYAGYGNRKSRVYYWKR